MSSRDNRCDPQDRARRLRARGGVRALHDARVVVVADEDPLVRRGQGEGRRLRAAGRRLGLRGHRRGHAPWAKITAWEPPHRFVLDWLIGNLAAPRSRCASRLKGRERESSSSIAAGTGSRTRATATTTRVAGTSCSRLSRPRARRRRRAAPRAGRRAGARRRARGAGAARTALSDAASSAGVHQRMPVTYSDASCSAREHAAPARRPAYGAGSTAPPARRPSRRGTG